jgi:hypothetical protein
MENGMFCVAISSQSSTKHLECPKYQVRYDRHEKLIVALKLLIIL